MFPSLPDVFPTTGTLAHQPFTEWLPSYWAEQGNAKGDDIRPSSHVGDLEEQEGPTTDRTLLSTVKSMLCHTERQSDHTSLSVSML